MSDKSDIDLVNQAARGDSRAFGELVARYEPVVRAFLAGRVAPDRTDDLVQDVFLRAHIGLGDLQDPAKFPGWLIGIAGNLVRMGYRRQRVQSSFLDEYEVSNPYHVQFTAQAYTPFDDLIETERDVAVREAISDLPEQTRTIVELHYLEGLSYQEIADRLSVRIPTIEGRLYRARKRLKEDLKMTQTTTDMFELQDKLTSLQEQVDELQKLQTRSVKEDRISLQQERSAAASQLCRLPADEDEPITWGIVGAIRTEAGVSKRHSIYSTSLQQYLDYLSNEQIARYASLFTDPDAVGVLKRIVKGGVSTKALAEDLDLSEDKLETLLTKLSEDRLIEVEDGKVSASHHDVTAGFFSLINITRNFLVHVTEEIDRDEDREKSKDSSSVTGSVTHARTHSRRG